MSSLDGTVALVTGASSGIGEATALALLAEGATVAFAARRREVLEHVAARVSDASRVLVHEADVTDEDQVRQLVQDTANHFGHLDILVNNAGLMLQGPILDAPSDEWRRMINLNLLGVCYCTHEALPYLLKSAAEGPRRVADVVNISSVGGRNSRRGNGVYSATKAAVNAFSESLRQEVAARHVRVTVIEPGLVATDLVTHNRPAIQDMLRVANKEIEPLLPEDVAAAVIYSVTRPRHVATNELMLRPTNQER